MGCGIFGKLQFLFQEPETHKRGAYHTHSLGKLDHVPDLNLENPIQTINFWEKRISANIPYIKHEIQKLKYGYAYSGDELDNHPCSRRMDINANEEIILKDVHDVVLATQMHKCSGYCEKPNQKSKKAAPSCRFVLSLFSLYLEESRISLAEDKSKVRDSPEYPDLV
ncbi:MAG: hypothetical protein RLZZ86_2625, partial [Cyanobacteriota bacterium]